MSPKQKSKKCTSDILKEHKSKVMQETKEYLKHIREVLNNKEVKEIA